MCNPNLLINPDFTHPVNQRGQTEYTGYGYTVDMWVTGYDEEGSICVSDGYIEMVRSVTGTWFNLWQYLETSLTDGTYTLSFLVDDYRKVSQVYAGEKSGSFGANFKFNNNICTYTFTIEKDIFVKEIGIQMKEERGSLKVYAAKLERGSYSTLVNDVVDYAAELRKCQRYLYVANEIGSGYPYFGSGTAYAWETAYVPIVVALPTKMRIYPTVSKVGAVKMIDVTTFAELVVNSVDTERSAADGMIELKVMADGIVAGHRYILTATGDMAARLYFNAEL